MQIASFKQVLQKSKPGQHLMYHSGELAIDRQYNADVEATAKLVFALHELGQAVIYQKREHGIFNYYVVPVRKLRTKRTGEGFADAERLAQLD